MEQPQKKKGMKLIWKVIIGCFAGFFILGFIGMALGYDKQPGEPAEKEPGKEKAKEPEPPKFVFDIPHLISLHRDEILSELGKPDYIDSLTELQKEMDMDQTLDFSKKGYDVSFETSPQTGGVIRAFIGATDQDGVMRFIDSDGIDSLKEACNIDSLSQYFHAEPQEALPNEIGKIQDKKLYTGLHIRTIKEQLKIDGIE